MSELFDGLSKSLDEAIDFAKGKKNGSRVTRMEFIPPESFNPNRIKKIRKEHELTQKMLAKLLNVSVETVKSWERGINQPNGPSARMLQLIDKRPDVVQDFFNAEAG